MVCSAETSREPEAGGGAKGVRRGALTALPQDTEARIGAAVARTVGLDAGVAAPDEGFWSRAREAFTSARNHIDRNSGSVSPAPASVQRAMPRYRDITNEGPSLRVDELLAPRIEVVRPRLAASFDRGADELALVRNASEAMEIVRCGRPRRAGGEVLTTTRDYGCSPPPGARLVARELVRGPSRVKDPGPRVPLTRRGLCDITLL